MIRNTVKHRGTTQNEYVLRYWIGIYVLDMVVRNWTTIAMIAVAFGGSCLLFLSATDAQDDKSPRLTSVLKGMAGNGVTASSGSGSSPDKSLQNWLTFDQCIVTAPESYEIAAREAGILSELKIAENELVKMGHPIGQLDSQSAELEREMAGIQSQIATSKAKDDSDVRLAESFLDEANFQLSSFEELVNKGGAAHTEVRQKSLAVQQAKTRLIKSNVEKLEREKQAKLAMAAYQLAEQKVERLKLVSPATGTVARIDRRPGEWVTAGTTIAKVVRLDELRIDFFVDTKQIDPTSLLHQPVTINVDRGVVGIQSFAGKITGYASEVSSLGKVLVNASVQNQQANNRWVLMPGMVVAIKLIPQAK